jgi:hypothetical protein
VQPTAGRLLASVVDSKNCIILWESFPQCCRAETICFSSGSNFQKVLAPEPAPAPTYALWVPVFTAFILKSRFFMTLLGKNIELIHFFDQAQYEL